MPFNSNGSVARRASQLGEYIDPDEDGARVKGKLTNGDQASYQVRSRPLPSSVLSTTDLYHYDYLRLVQTYLRGFLPCAAQTGLVSYRELHYYYKTRYQHIIKTLIRLRICAY